MTWEMTLQNTFLDVVNLSITASFVIVMVLVLRAILNRVPKKFVCLLWLVVLFRLLCPVTLELPVSLVPSHTPIEYEMVYTTPQVETDSPIVNEVLNQTVNPMLQQSSAPTPAASVNPSQIYLFIASLVWIAGVIGLLGYTLFSWVRLRRQVAESEPKYKGVYLCGTIASPFVFGVIRPKIYLPYGMSEEDEKFVLLHERSHIAHKDFIVKPLFWLAVMIHWMNPLVWVAWYYFGRDMELACDECAIEQLNDAQKNDYSTTLLQLATQPKCLHCPMAFGNNSVKLRIQRVLKYKKLPKAVLALVMILIVLVGVGLLADKEDPNLFLPEATNDKFYFVLNGQKYTDTTFYADLNHDNKDEFIVVDISDWGEHDTAHFTIYKNNGKVLFNDDLHSSHAGWGNYFLYEQDGKDYLLKFMPTIYQGYATYSWQLLDFDWRGKLRVVDEDEVVFDSNKELIGSDKEAVEQFLNQLAPMLENAALLVSVENGELQYSSVNSPKTLTLSHYLNPKDWAGYWNQYWEQVLREQANEWGDSYMEHDGEKRYALLSKQWKETVDDLDEFEGIGLDWMPYWLDDKKSMGLGNSGLFVQMMHVWRIDVAADDGGETHKATIRYEVLDSEQKEYIYEEIITFGQENDQWVVTDCEIAINYLPVEIYGIVEQIMDRLENGHDTWRKDPEQVVHHFLHDYLNITNEVQMQWNAEKNIMLCTTDETTYTIYLYKPIQAGTPHIFYAVSGYQYEEVDENGETQLRHFHVGNDPWASLHVEE